MATRGAYEQSAALPKSAFGEVEVSQLEPFIQATAAYNLVPANFREFTATGGSTGASDGMFFASTGTSVGGYGAIQSFRSVNYKAGQGAMARFTALFESTAGPDSADPLLAGSWQGAGLISVGDELSFGYSGTSFGIWYRYGGLPEVRTITVTTPASGSETLTLTLNGVAYSIALSSGDAEHNAYEIAQHLNTNQSVWHADNIDGTVVIIALSDGAKSGSYSFSSDGAAVGSIAQNTAGVTKTSTHIPQSNWNQNPAEWLDPSKGNVYQIAFQYLGFGAITFSVEDPDTGAIIAVHIIRYANANTSPSLGNPSLRVGFYCASLQSTTNLTVKSASMGAFVQGTPENTRNPRAVDNTQELTSTDETTVLAVRNRKTYNARFNQVEIEPELLTVANEGTKNVTVRLRASANPGVELQYTAAGTNLVSDVATDSRAFSGGRTLATTVVAGGSQETIDLLNLKIRVPPTLQLIVTGQRNSGGSASDVTASLTYYEDL